MLTNNNHLNKIYKKHLKKKRNIKMKVKFLSSLMYETNFQSG